MPAYGKHVVAVDNAAATGTVTFKEGTTTLGTGTLSGGTPNEATFTTTALTAGSHSITATYNGDAAYASSTSNTVTQVVTQAATTATLTSSPNPSDAGASVTFTATVNNANATGTVTFKEGTTVLGTGTLSGGSPNTATFSTSSLSIGTHLITAVYEGDANFTTSTSNVVTQTVNAALATPANVVATATTTTSVNVTWSAVTGAVNYEVYRQLNSVWVLIGTPTTSSFTDSTVLPNTTYIYRVRAVSAQSTFSAYSNADFATTVIFSNDPLAAGVAITAAHMQQIRTAVDAVRVAMGLAPATYTNTINSGSPVRALDVNETRSALTAARSAFGYATTFTNTVSAGGRIKALDYQEMRDQTK